MERIYEGAPLPPLPEGSVVSVGTFDGVHLGHQRVVAELRALAADRRCPAVVITFDRHPASVVRPEMAPRVLTGLAHKLELLERCGVDYAYVIRFDEERSLEAPDAFVADVLEASWHARAAVEGENFHFGHHAAGDLALLRECGDRGGFDVVGVPLVLDDIGAPVSSDAIRAALNDGDVARATAQLGRPHEVRGVVEPGDSRGRELGFPTANIAVPGDIQLPADGVYAGWYEGPDGVRHATALSIGRRPTFYAESGLLLVEAYLLDFDGDLYGQPARVTVDHWLRGQVRFESVDALVEQLRLDVDETRRLLL